MRGVEAKMYKEQEGLRKKTHSEIEDDYISQCSSLESYGAIFFPARVREDQGRRARVGVREEQGRRARAGVGRGERRSREEG